MLRSRRVKPSKSGLEEAGLLEFYAATHLHHAGNKPEWYGRPFLLEPFQRENIWNPLFGTGRLVGRGESRRFQRRYRSALIGMPRDFGKTELICAMLLSEANMNPVNMGQYGVVAYDRTQAQKVLATLGAMILQDAELAGLWEPYKSEITNRETGAVIKVFPYSPGAIQSWHFNLLIADELHVWRDATVHNAIQSGMGNVENSLLLAITTAGEARSGFLWDWIAGNERTGVESILDDPSAYVWWWGADDADGLYDEAVWERLALPSWVTVDNIRRQRRKLTRRDFERYILNRFPVERGPDRSLRPADIAACASVGRELDLGRPFSLAVDGAVRGDAFALVAHQVQDGVHVFREWVYDEPPEDRGYYDLAAVGSLVAGLCQRYRCPVGIDPSRLLLWANVLQDEYGCEIYEVRQSNEIMCSASALMVNAVRGRAAALAGCPKLAEHLGNCLDLERPPYGTRFTSGKHGQGSARIDAAIAGAMAMWMTTVMPPPVSFAESGGVWDV